MNFCGGQTRKSRKVIYEKNECTSANPRVCFEHQYRRRLTPMFQEERSCERTGVRCQPSRDNYSTKWTMIKIKQFTMSNKQCTIKTFLGFNHCKLSIVLCTLKT